MSLSLRHPTDGRLVALAGASVVLESRDRPAGAQLEPLVRVRLSCLEALLARLSGSAAPDGLDLASAPAGLAPNAGPETDGAGLASGPVHVQLGEVRLELDGDGDPGLGALLGEQPGWCYLALCAHYAQTWCVSAAALQSAAVALDGLRDRARQVAEAGPLEGSLSDQGARLRTAFWRALLEDLDTPSALAVVWQIARAELPASERRLLLLEVDAVLDLGLAEAATPAEEALPDGAEALIEQRAAARAARQWAESDALRDRLAALGVETQDGPAGSVYRRR
jgi:hypothetical protein